MKKLFSERAAVLNGSYSGKDKLPINMSWVDGVCTAIANGMTLPNHNKAARHDLKVGLTTLSVAVIPITPSIKGLADQLKLRAKFREGLVHSMGGDEKKAKQQGLEEHPILIALDKAFGANEDGELGKVPAEFGDQVIALAKKTVAEGIASTHK